MTRRTSYFWALHVDDTAGLSDAGYDGLDYARQLAEDAKLRAEHVLEHRPLFPPLTISELAEIRGVTTHTISRRIAIARRELFGDLTDSGIYYRLRRQRELATRPDRHCHQPGCNQKLARAASAARCYCDEHRTPRARTDRHRQARQDTSEPDNAAP